MKKIIYLAGPIAGLNFTEANDWRTYCQKKFEPGIVGISPLRCEPLEPGKLYAEDDSVIKMWSDPRAISCKNWLDTESSDLVLAYLPKEMNDRRPSIGTIIEIGWAIGLRKPLIVVSDDDYVMEHPLIEHNASWRFGEIDEAIEVIHGLFGDYIEQPYKWH